MMLHSTFDNEVYYEKTCFHCTLRSEEMPSHLSWQTYQVDTENQAYGICPSSVQGKGMKKRNM